MNDPFLQAHEAFPLFYWMSLPLSPISIRDQMVRGKMIIDRAFENEILVEGQDKGILVVGAGACGVTAAMTAAARNVPTVLIDRGSSAFHLQNGALTRYLDPTQYDWPLDHWQEGNFPWGALPAMPLPYQADIAGNVAAFWNISLNNFLSKHKHGSKLTILWKTEIKNFTLNPSNASVMVKLSQAGGSSYHRDEFGLVIWAAGHGTETCVVESNSKKVVYRGRPFWSIDYLTRPQCGLSVVPEVIIAGGGDGGLQDFLRAITKCESAKEIYKACKIPSEIERVVQSAEDRAHRCYIWGNPENKRHDHAVHLMLQADHSAAVQKALKSKQVRAGLKHLFPNTPDNVRLVYRCSHFENFYGLNRFLVLLIASYLEQVYSMNNILVPNASITDVSSKDGHSCASTMIGGCDGRPHSVELSSYPDCRKGIGGPLRKLDANLIVIRYGIDSANLKLSTRVRSAITRPRHSLPYHVPP